MIKNIQYDINNINKTEHFKDRKEYGKWLYKYKFWQSNKGFIRDKNKIK